MTYSDKGPDGMWDDRRPNPEPPPEAPAPTGPPWPEPEPGDLGWGAPPREPQRPPPTSLTPQSTLAGVPAFGESVVKVLVLVVLLAVGTALGCAGPMWTHLRWLTLGLVVSILLVVTVRHVRGSRRTPRGPQG